MKTATLKFTGLAILAWASHQAYSFITSMLTNYQLATDKNLKSQVLLKNVGLLNMAFFVTQTAGLGSAGIGYSFLFEKMAGISTCFIL